MGGVLGRLFKVKKLELVLVGIENSCEPRPTAPAWLFRRSTLCQPRLGPRRLAPRRGRWRGPAPRAGGPEARRVRSRPRAGASLLASSPAHRLNRCPFARSGKSTLLNMMAMGTSIQTVPTVGLSVKTMKHAGVSMKVRALRAHVGPPQTPGALSERSRCVADRRRGTWGAPLSFGASGGGTREGATSFCSWWTPMT